MGYDRIALTSEELERIAGAIEAAARDIPEPASGSGYTTIREMLETMGHEATMAKRFCLHVTVERVEA